MSAYVVDKAHIDALIRAAMDSQPRSRCGPLRWWWGENNEHQATIGYFDDDTARQVGRMLWLENVRSVQYRYPDVLDGGTYPGPLDFSPTDVDAYELGRYSAKELEPVEVLKALDGYEYQSCEHPEWPKSAAFAFCQALRRRVIHLLPGYDEADWTIGL